MEHRWLAISTGWQCNARCVACELWKTRGHFLDPRELEKALVSSKGFFTSLRFAGLFGGEPTIHPELMEVISVIRRQVGSSPSIVTNGFLPDVIRASRKAGCFICVSLDGREEVHNRKRGREDAYDRVMESLNWSSRISFTVAPDNIDELPFIYEMAARYKCDISIRLRSGGSYFHGRIFDEWSSEDIDRLEEMIKTNDKAKWCLGRFAVSMPEFLRNGNKNLRKCSAPDRVIIVDPNLDVRHCHSLEPFGNLNTLFDDWESVEKPDTAKCFRRECYIDGPYATSFL